MKKFILFALMVIASCQIYAQSSELDTEIAKMIEKSGAIKNYESMIPQICQMAKAQNPNITDEQMAVIQESMNNNGMDKFMKKCIPVYAKYLTLEDVKAINAFYDTPAGKKLVEATPNMTTDMMPIAIEWSQELAVDIKNKLDELNK